MSRSPWDDAATAAAYRAFERRHPRYRRANEALARHAALRPDARVLDLAAGTGGTTAALLPQLGPAARVDCLEPALAMAAAGRERLGPDPRVRWLTRLDEAQPPYDRIVCGAALWQWPSLRSVLHQLARRLAPGGALVFNVPGAYLGQPDGPGSGADPCLTGLMAELAARHPPVARSRAAATLPAPAQVDAWLSEAGLHAERWQHRQRLSQGAWCDWWQLPVLSRALWPRVPAPQRAQRIADAARRVDPHSWRPEHWLGWTAFKPGLATRPLPDATPLQASPEALRRHAARDGVLLLRGLLPQRTVGRLRHLMLGAARTERLLDARGHWTGGAAAAPHELPRWLALQQRMGMLAAFQALVQSPQLLQVVASITGVPMEGGRGSVCRIAPPEHWTAATPSHRDAEYLRDSLQVWGAWIPLSACPVSGGGLAVAPGTQHGGAASHWAAADMRPGDVLMLSAQTLHRGCPNLRLRRARLSIDLRFGPAPA